ncbi:DUF4261 domain-containing protein, partial [Ruminococcaceae bacterium OttesenSCG-928-L11]|nr:DUF4261 domain-containing protein [Ruminococcaceae bacterium OttesenSCG-928-L11]
VEESEDEDEDLEFDGFDDDSDDEYDEDMEEEEIASDEYTLVFEVDGMLATVALMPGPVPEGEAEHNAATNYLWPEAVEETKRHVAHLVVAVLPRDNDYLQAGQLLVKLCETCMRDDGAIGIYTAGTVFQPAFYREAAAVMHDGELPYLNWVYFGLCQSENGWMNGYTYGLECFGKAEIEVLDTVANPSELRDFLFNISAYVLSSNVTLRDGETIGFTADQKLPITLSEGVYLDGETLKIGFKPANT